MQMKKYFLQRERRQVSGSYELGASSAWVLVFFSWHKWVLVPGGSIFGLAMGHVTARNKLPPRVTETWTRTRFLSRLETSL